MWLLRGMRKNKSPSGCVVVDCCVCVLRLCSCVSCCSFCGQNSNAQAAVRLDERGSLWLAGWLAGCRRRWMDGWQWQLCVSHVARSRGAFVCVVFAVLCTNKTARATHITHANPHTAAGSKNVLHICIYIYIYNVYIQYFAI